MKFRELLQIVKDEPVFESGLLLAGKVNPTDVRRQLSRWVNAGLIYQLRRGVYALAPPYQKTKPHPFVVANKLVRASYVSLQSALAYYGLIPEYTPGVTGVTSGRPWHRRTPLGDYHFRHIKPDWFHSYQRLALGNEQYAFVALPEKALLDLIALTPKSDHPNYLSELRLQSLDKLDLGHLTRLAEESNRPKLRHATELIVHLATDSAEDYQTL